MKLTAAAKLFKALSSEQRLRVLQVITEMSAKGEGCSGATRAFTRCCEELSLSPSTVSHHFKELETAGVITVERRGQCCCCHVNGRIWERLQAFLQQA